MVKVFAGIVTYNPDLNLLKKCIHAVKQQIRDLIIVDNGSSNLPDFKNLIESCDHTVWIQNKENIGSAAALNEIMNHASTAGADWVLLLDDDSIVPQNMMREYVKYMNHASAGIISPVIRDRLNVSETVTGSGPWEYVDKCITSGSLNKVSVWKECGGFNEQLFIDSVDYEYAYRIRRHGYRVIRVNGVTLDHSVGNTTSKYIGPVRLSTYNHSAFRKYYITRNELYIAHEYPEYGSVFNVKLRLMKRAAIVIVMEDDKKNKLIAMKKGIKDYEAMINNQNEQDTNASSAQYKIHFFDYATVKQAFIYLRQYGLTKTLKRMGRYLKNDVVYDQWFQTHRISEEELKKQRNIKFMYQPVISLIVPTFNTPIDMLKMMIETVRNQSYSNWQLCIADGSDTDSKTRKTIIQYRNLDPRIKVVLLDKNHGISGNTNKALELANGEYCALYDHDDFLEPDALFEIVAELQRCKYDCLYTDEDKYSEVRGRFEEPALKPDFSIDLLRSHNYIAHLFIVKTEILKRIGGLHSAYDGSQDYDAILRCIEKAKTIKHIPRILYHWRIHDGSTAKDPESKMYCYIAGEKAIASHIERMNINGSVNMMPEPYYGLYHLKYLDADEQPLVSAIIVNPSNVTLLNKCIKSLKQVNEYLNLQIMISISRETNNQVKKECEKLITEKNVTVQCIAEDINEIETKNLMANKAESDYILFLNSEMEQTDPQAIYDMLGCLMRKEVGAVGPMIVGDHKKVIHAGMVLGINGTAGEIFQNIDPQDIGYMARLKLRCNYSAISASCLMTKKTLFEKLGGFDKGLPVLYGVDYCLRLRKVDQLIVYTGFTRWREHHFKTVEVSNEEKKLFQERYKDELEAGDPYYNPNFNLNGTTFELR